MVELGVGQTPGANARLSQIESDEFSLAQVLKMRSGVPAYVFLLINHLGESFEARELDFADDQQALDHARSLAGRNYPVEVRLDGRCIARAPMAEWQVEDWLKPYLGPWPLS